MSLDQAHQLRQLVRNAADGGAVRGTLPMVVVSGGKGGVGASTIAMQLATAVSRLGSRIVLVEADLDRGGQVKQACDGFSIADCLAGRQSVSDALEPGEDGIWVLPGAWAPRDLTECTATAQDRLIQELRSLRAHADLLVVDAGSNRNPFVRKFWRVASMVLVISTPDANATMDAYAAIKVLLAGETSIPVYTLVNFATDSSNTFLAHERVRVTCKRFLGLRTSSLGGVPTMQSLREPNQRSSMIPTIFDPLAHALCEELGMPVSGMGARRIAA
jgi:flagellar biosynthesis protein FlhG